MYTSNMLTENEILHARKIDRYYNLYKADFRKGGLRYLYGEQGEDTSVIEVIENLPKKVSRLFSNMMFLEEYTLTIENHTDEKADKIRDFLYRQQFQKKLIQSAQSQSYGGYAVFELSEVEGKAVITLIKPDYTFLEEDVDGTYSKIKIGWYVEQETRKFLFLKTHTKQTITAEVFECDVMGKPITGTPLDPSTLGYDIPAEQPQFEQGIPVFIIHNDIHDVGNVYGSSDYEGNETILQELTRNFSQIGNELHHFGNAILAVGEGVLDRNGRPKVKGMKMIEINTQEKAFIPQYITNSNPQIDKAQAHHINLLLSFCRATDIAEILLGLNTSGGAEKVGALKLRLLLTLARVKAKLHSYHAVLPSLVAFAARIEGLELSADDVYFTFHDGLPEDMQEKVDIEMKRYSAGIQSLEDAIKNLDNLDAEELQAKIETIKKEETANIPFHTHA